MILSTSQVNRFWREWPKACSAQNWTRAAGMTTAEIDRKRKEFLARCGFTSLTEVDRTDGFTKVLNELLVLQGTSIKAGIEAEDPSLNRARVLRHHICAVLIPCLEVYVEDVLAYVTTIMEDKNRWWKIDRPERGIQLTDLDAKQLKQLQYTLAARLNAKRKEADDTIHDMNLKAHVPCRCARCQPRRPAKLIVADFVETEEEKQPF